MEPRCGKIRRPLDGATKCRERLIQVTKLAKRHADCVLDDGIAGIDRSGAAKLYERQIELAETEVREALLPVWGAGVGTRGRLLTEGTARDEQEGDEEKTHHGPQGQGAPAGSGPEPSRTIRTTICRSSRSGSSPRFSAFSLVTLARRSVARSRSPLRRYA
jgi:hypothetical protein